MTPVYIVLAVLAVPVFFTVFAAIEIRRNAIASEGER